MNYQPSPHSEELKMAKKVQEGLLSVESPDIPGVLIAKRYLAADSVGGDFYTFVSKQHHAMTSKSKMRGVVEYRDTRENQLGVIIGDVAGHGVSSALVMALSSGLLSEIAKQCKTPSETLIKANQALLKYIETSQIRYVTVFYLSVLIQSKTVVWAKAGHPDVLLIKKEGGVSFLEAEGVVLGMYDQETYQDFSCTIDAGDRLFLYTDGLTERRNPDGEEFGIERLRAFCQETVNLPIETVLDQLIQRLDLFSNHQPLRDDQTMVLIELEG